MNTSAPRRKRMNQKSRLQSAKRWIPTYQGSNIIKGYKNWFGVDWPCAIQELKILGIKVDDRYVSQVLQSHEQRIASKRKAAEEKKKSALEDLLVDSDETFYYIAGYTNGGFPYGITWEEFQNKEKNK